MERQSVQSRETPASVEEKLRELRHLLNDLQHEAKSQRPDVGMIASGVDDAIELWRQVARPLGVEY